jgi:WD40 repeat protein
MKYYINLLLFIILNSSAFGSSLSLFSVDNTQFPVMKAKLFALDQSGNLISGLNTTDFILKEDGVTRLISALNCPEVKPPDAISSVLTIDISGSMAGEGIKKAKAAATAWINTLPLGKSECAITSFDNENYLNCDFSTDKNKLQKAIDSLKAQGGTDFNAALLDQMSGSLLIAESGKHQKIIVLLTDGFAYGSEQEIIQKAKSMNAVIYCVVLANPAPEILKNVALATGGTYFENINTAEEASEAYNNILQMAQGGNPCEIEWTSAGCPNNRVIDLSIPSHSISTSITYSVPFEKLPNVSLLPSTSLRFGAVVPGYFSKNTIKIICGATEVFISEIKTDNALFKVKNFPTAGLDMKSGDQFDLNVEFNPADSSYQFARFELVSNACRGTFFYCSGGFTGSSIAPNTLFINEPNGGEIYSASADTLISWGGVSPDDTMKIELSTDGGMSWELITNTARDLQQKITMPAINSDKCLIRVKQLEGNGTKLKTYAGHSFFVDNIALSPDGRYLSSTGNDRVFKVIDLKTDEQVFKTTGVYIYQYSAFSPDGTMLAVGLSDFSVQIFSTLDWSIIKTIDGNDGWVSSVSFDPSSKILAVADNSNKIRLINLDDNSTLATLKTHTNTITALKWLKSDSTLLSSSKDGSIKQWSNKGEAIKSINIGQEIISMTIGPDNYKAAIITNSGTLVKIIDIQSSAELNSFIPENRATTIDWCPDGTIITIADNLGYVNFYSTDSYQFVKKFSMHASTVNQLLWSNNGRFIASCGNDNYIKTMDFELIIQEAISKNYWEITPPSLSINKVDFGYVAVANSKDSVLKSYIKNTSKIPIIVKKIEFTGTALVDYFLVSGIPPYIIEPDSSKSIEILFTPKEEGFRGANINIVCPNFSVQNILSGIGYQSKIEYISKYINFGKCLLDFPVDTNIQVLKNKSDQDIIFSNLTIIGPDKAQFSIPEIESKTVKPGEYLTLKFRYLPIEKGKANTAITIDFTGCDCKAQIQLFGEGYSECGESSFKYNDFTNVNNLEFVGHAMKLSSSALKLTEASVNSTGAIWTKAELPLDSGFSSEFSFKITDPYQYENYETSEPGADGLAFVIQNTSNKEFGTNGGGIGYEGIKNAIAIEIDLFNNNSNQIVDKGDLNGNHVALMVIKNDSVINANHGDNTLALNTNILTIKSNGSIYYCKVVYDAVKATIEFYIDTTKEYKNPAIKVENFDIKNYITLAYNSGAYFGFTSACGSSYQMHQLLSWNLCTALSTNPIISDVAQFSKLYQPNVYPNPATQTCQLHIKTNIGDRIHLEGFDLLGRKTGTDIYCTAESLSSVIEIINNNSVEVEFIKITINNINNKDNYLVPIYWE